MHHKTVSFTNKVLDIIHIIYVYNRTWVTVWFFLSLKANPSKISSVTQVARMPYYSI